MADGFQTSVAPAVAPAAADALCFDVAPLDEALLLDDDAIDDEAGWTPSATDATLDVAGRLEIRDAAVFYEAS